MKKITILLFVGMLLTVSAYSQMSFKGNSLKKSGFDLSEQKTSILEEKITDSKILISDEDNDVAKKRRKKGRGRRGGGGDFSNSIKTNPLSMIFGYFGAMYERKIGDNMSLGLTLGLYSRSTGITGAEYSYSGFTINPEFRYYFEEAIEGWYVAPYITFTSISQKFVGSESIFDPITMEYTTIPTESKSTISVYGGGVVGGRQWIWSGFTLDVYAGIGYTGMSGDAASGGLSFSGILPAFGTAIGYSF